MEAPIENISNPTSESKDNNCQSPNGSTIRKVRAQALSEYLSAQGYLTMDEATYTTWKQRGWSRRELDRAIEDLIVKGEANLETFGTILEVTLAPKGVATS